MIRRSTYTAEAVAALVIALASASTAQAQARPTDPERAAVRQVMLEMASYVQEGKWAVADSLFATEHAWRTPV